MLLAGAQLVDFGVHGLQIAGRRDLPGQHPLLDLMATAGRGRDPLLQLSLSASEIVHARLHFGQLGLEDGLPLLQVTEEGPFGQRLHPVTKLIEGGVVLLDPYEGVERFGHHHSSC